MHATDNLRELEETEAMSETTTTKTVCMVGVRIDEFNPGYIMSRGAFEKQISSRHRVFFPNGVYRSAWDCVGIVPKEHSRYQGDEEQVVFTEPVVVFEFHHVGDGDANGLSRLHGLSLREIYGELYSLALSHDYYSTDDGYIAYALTVAVMVTEINSEDGYEIELSVLGVVNVEEILRERFATT